MEGTGVDRKMILKWILKEEDGDAWTGFVLLRIRPCGRTTNSGMPQGTENLSTTCCLRRYTVVVEE